MNDNRGHLHSLSLAGVLITIGIIFGDIGTSPLYVLKSIVGAAPINEKLIMGGLSCIFWTLTLQTTVKYVLIVLNADNKGEGGILSLYALVRRRGPAWFSIIAMIGGCALLADGIITPSISVSAAVEGLRQIDGFQDMRTIPIVLAILTGIFIFQQFGTDKVGKSFGPIMVVWFGMLAVLGLMGLSSDMSVLAALNPWYAYDFLSTYPGGFWILGAVFLCTTGAEALYSDLGHCGKENIRVSWIFVKTALILNYFGQGAWLISHPGLELGGLNPFFLMMPKAFVPVGVLIATMAAIVASQAVITGSFTLINEAMRLNFWPRFRVSYPTEVKGQMYIPAVNWLLFFGCIFVIAYFKESERMEAAYGLAIILAMMMTTVLLVAYLRSKRLNALLVALVSLAFFAIELSFLVANLPKFAHGGFVALIVSGSLFVIMYIWAQAKKIKNKYIVFEDLRNYENIIEDLAADHTIPKYATNLVFLTGSSNRFQVESKIIYSIIKKSPKRADNYWILHVDVVDEPYTAEYRVTKLANGNITRIDFRLGFRIDPKINVYFRKVVGELVEQGEANITSRYPSLAKSGIPGDFRFVLIEKYLSGDNKLPFLQGIAFKVYDLLRLVSVPSYKAFGLETSSVEIEKVPLIISPSPETKLNRIES